MTDSGANPTAAFISINQPNAYPTTVNTSGKKQAFLMSGSDVSNGLGTYGDLIPSVKYHLDKLQRNGTGLNWLRSPGIYMMKQHNFIQDMVLLGIIK